MQKTDQAPKESVLEMKGKVALVTGGAQGIGKAIALLLAQQGSDVVISDVNLEKAEETAREIEALGRRAMAIRANVAVCGRGGRDGPGHPRSVRSDRYPGQ